MAHPFGDTVQAKPTKHIKEVFMSKLQAIFIFILMAALCTAVSARSTGRVLLVDSYHEGYFWSDSIIKGAMTVFDGKEVTVEKIHMDTKRNTSEEFKISAGKSVKDRIDNGQYDVVIAMDDNASKYVVMPFFRDGNPPFVFCGVNWDASIYGYPYKNATGMVEISPIMLALKHLNAFVKGDRIAFLGADTTTGHKNLENFKQILKLEFAAEALVRTFDEWKNAFLDLQQKTDMLVLSAPGGVSDWDDAAVEAFILENVRIPVATDEPEFKSFAVLGFTKIPEEHGEYAATVALKLMDGASISDFPVVQSQRGDLVLNMKIAKKLGIKFPFSLVKMAKPENIIK